MPNIKNSDMVELTDGTIGTVLSSQHFQIWKDHKLVDTISYELSTVLGIEEIVIEDIKKVY